MRGDRRVTRAVVATVLVLVAAGAALAAAVAAAFIWGGVFNVAASEPHWPVTRWALDKSLESSVESASKHISAPSVGPERVSRESLRTYASECAVCHGAPGRDRPEMASNMRPQPPPLAEVELDWSPSQRFWIVKNGIKMTGMPAWGPVLPDEEIWDLVAVTFALPTMTQEAYTQGMQGDDAGNGDAAPDGEAAEADGAAQDQQQTAAANPQPTQNVTVIEPESTRQAEDAEQQLDTQQTRPMVGQEVAAGDEAPAEDPADDAEQATAGETGEDAGQQPASGEAAEDEAADGGVAATVDMTADLTFEPQTITISAGDTVRWANPSEVPHTVTADEDKANDPSHVRLPDGAEPFDSGFIGPEGTYERTFTVPGRYVYFCIPHEAQGMIGEIVVE